MPTEVDTSILTQEGLKHLLSGYDTKSRPLGPKKLKTYECLISEIHWQIIEQNSGTTSQWATIARNGKEVMQVLRARKYYGVVVSRVFTKY